MLKLKFTICNSTHGTGSGAGGDEDDVAPAGTPDSTGDEQDNLGGAQKLTTKSRVQVRRL